MWSARDAKGSWRSLEKIARNFGVNKATGQYILFVDGDDILTPWLLESAVQAVEDYDCDVIVGMINTTDKRPSIFPSREKNVKFELLDDHKKKELECHIFSKSCERWRPDQDGWEFNGEGCWAHFLKKEIALENQFIPGVAVGEDTIWALTIFFVYCQSIWGQWNCKLYKEGSEKSKTKNTALNK